jgi:PAS domain S-box-containing protein
VGGRLLIEYLNTISVVDAVDDPLFVIDEKGAVLEWNRGLVTATGYSDEELTTAMPAALFIEADAGRLRGTVAKAGDSGTETFEAELVTADGGRIPYEWTVHRISDTVDPVTAVVLGRDLTDRAEARRERRDALERMSDGFFAVDTEWRLTDVNETGAKLLSGAMDRSLSPDALEGVHLWDEIPAAVDTTFYERYHEAMATQEPVTFEEYYAPLDSRFDVRVYPTATGLAVYLSDVTEYRRQRDALENRERVLREMYDIIADRDREFTEQVSALLKLGRAELDTDYGTLSEIRGDEYRFEVVDAVDDSIQSGDVVPLSATNCELAASTEQTVVLGDIARDAPTETDRAGYADWGISCYIGAPVFAGDDVYGTFCFYGTEPRDEQFSEWEVTLVDLMSRWVSYELQRQRDNDRLQRQNKRLDGFASIVSHDLRNPLNVLEGRLELAEETGDPEEFAHCHDAIERMDTLIEDLLTLARSGEIIDTETHIGIGSLVERCWLTVPTEAATLRIETDRTVSADETRFRQLIENLVRNACEHGGEAVTVTVGDLPGGFYIEDDGPGIPAAIRDEVLEMGYSSTSDGTGFGLAIVTEIADAHGWDVRVTDGTEGGARFEFTGVSITD